MTRKQGKRLLQKGYAIGCHAIRRGLEREVLCLFQHTHYTAHCERDEPVCFARDSPTRLDDIFLFLPLIFSAGKKRTENAPRFLSLRCRSLSLPALELADLHPTTVAIMLVTHQSRL